MTTTPDDLRVTAAARLDDAATDALLEAVDGADDEKVRALVDALGPSPRRPIGEREGPGRSCTTFRLAGGVMTAAVDRLHDLRDRAYSAIPRLDELGVLVDTLKARTRAVAAVPSVAAVEGDLIVGIIEAPRSLTTRAACCSQRSRRRGWPS